MYEKMKNRFPPLILIGSSFVLVNEKRVDFLLANNTDFSRRTNHNGNLKKRKEKIRSYIF